MKAPTLLALTLAMMASAPVASAQSITAPVTADTTAVAADNSTESHTAVRSSIDQPAAVHRDSRLANSASMRSASSKGLGEARALMFVGAGAFVAGAIIGGDSGTIIMVGGAVIGLYGLYEYLK